MSGARDCSPTGVRPVARRAQSPASGDPSSEMQGNVTVGHGGDHWLRQSITIKSKVESSGSAKTVVTCTSERGSSTRSVVQQRSTTSGGHPEVVRAATFSREMTNGTMETINTYEDSRTGVRQLSVGRHIGDRSHVSEKSRNEFTGVEEKTERLVNIPYEELGGFESEWRQRTARN
ncbi:myeloid leukemia factor 2-like isoform X2 [Dermacentor andersoni]|uniref:myeloid leukemia factor 2-like isoform X2 n=1 Tax=Dermacentor andersoni TaxID=34620 RepID=UPI002415B0F9|nr:myeloid leukemia factor 2-like isoform X2 [Dermacentor andersoni]